MKENTIEQQVEEFLDSDGGEALLSGLLSRLQDRINSSDVVLINPEDRRARAAQSAPAVR